MQVADSYLPGGRGITKMALAETYKGRMEMYDPGSPKNLLTDYITLFDISGEGFIDMMKISFTNLTSVMIKVTIDGTTYYEFNLSDLKNKVRLTRDEQDTFLNTARNSFCDSYTVPLFFENSFKVEVKKLFGTKKIKGAILRYRVRGD